jgi:glycosyltransferase involved in cell wall biosynthesis
MRILMIHNYYQQRGGEDCSVDAEIALLRQYGHEVATYVRHNDEIMDYGMCRRLGLVGSPTWSWRAARDTGRLIDSFRPNVLHLQNSFPLISPSVLREAHKRNIPTVATLRNYRTICPAATLFRSGSICRLCMNSSPWIGTCYACYHQSRIQTLPVSLAISLHHMFRTWHRHTTLFVSLSAFAREVFIEAGFPAESIRVRPNFLPPPPLGNDTERTGALYVGRLSPEKGIDTLLDAWEALPHIPLTFLGDGPSRPAVERFIASNPNHRVFCAGTVDTAGVIDALSRARLLIMPSEWYETFGRTIMEAFSVSTPVIASDLGCMSELITEGTTGILYPPGDVNALRAAVRSLYHETVRLRQMGEAARRFYLQALTPEQAIHNAEAIYEEAVQRRARYHESSAS